ncbi:MAG: hypothetical protein KBE22_12630 [Candidatus Accumulibacter sp.]|nr:hypothetical protein [Accumulibacter sp.]
MDIDLDPAIEADLEFIAAKTLIPAADIACALVTAGLHGWSHPLVCQFWANSGITIQWPKMAAQDDA